MITDTETLVCACGCGRVADELDRAFMAMVARNSRDMFAAFRRIDANRQQEAEINEGRHVEGLRRFATAIGATA